MLLLLLQVALQLEKVVMADRSHGHVCDRAGRRGHHIGHHQLLTLVLLELDLLLPLLLRLPDQAVLFQLGNKINNYFPSRLANFRIQIRFSLNSP